MKKLSQKNDEFSFSGYLMAFKIVPRTFCDLGVRFFGRIRKRICDPRSYGFFNTKETQNPKKDYFVMQDRLEARNIYIRTIFLSFCPRLQLERNTNNL